jgi:subtilisin family serine protease
MSLQIWKAVVIALFAAAAAAAFPAASATSAPAPRAASRLDPHLAALLTDVRNHRPAARLRLLRSYWRPGDLRGGALTVEIVAARGSKPVRSLVRRLGGRVTSAYAGLVEASVPLRGVDALAQRRSVRTVRPPIRFWPAAVSEGVATTAARAWQRAGRNGRGVKIAVVDGGFSGYRARERAGDLPRDAKAKNFCGSAGFSGPSVSEHGTAVAEIVHDMAPNAQLFLVCADTTPAVRSAASYALAHGVRIANFSQGTYSARGDGTGALDTIVSNSSKKGLLWVVAAGNAGDGHWHGTFADSNGNGLLDFAPGVERLPIAVPGGVGSCVDMRWDNWPLTNQNYDLAVVNDTGHRVAWSSIAQNGSQPPFEEACWTNGSPFTEEFGVEVVHQSGPVGARIDVFLDDASLERFDDPSGTISDPATAPAALAVGAVCYRTGVIEQYSSRGPTVDGRTKPDLAGPDGVTTATYGRADGCDSNGFFGTSAASPHVAGAAALVLQGSPSRTVSQLRRLIEARVVDRGAAGADDEYGAGSLALGVPLRLRDLLAPAVTALPTHGRVGGTIALRFRSNDPDSSLVRIAATIELRRRVAARLTGRGSIDGAVAALHWRPRAPGRFRWCVRATDRAGHRSAVSCAPAIVR